jgi:hypothetical protein
MKKGSAINDVYSSCAIGADIGAVAPGTAFACCEVSRAEERLAPRTWRSVTLPLSALETYANGDEIPVR